MPFSEAPLRASGTFSRRSRRVARRTFDDVRATGVRRSSPAIWIGLAIRGRILHDAREESDEDRSCGDCDGFAGARSLQR